MLTNVMPIPNLQLMDEVAVKQEAKRLQREFAKIGVYWDIDACIGSVKENMLIDFIEENYRVN